MSAQARRSIYDKVVLITDAFLGPAAGRFVDRQVRNHLHKEPKDLTEKDLSRLIGWIRPAVSVLTDDSQMIEEYIGQLEQVTRASRPKKSG